jgi:hypothetical protein
MYGQGQAHPGLALPYSQTALADVRPGHAGEVSPALAGAECQFEGETLSRPQPPMLPELLNLLIRPRCMLRPDRLALNPYGGVVTAVLPSNGEAQ